MMEYSIITIGLATILTFISGTCLSWTSPEIPYLNITDTGPFNGTLTEEEASWIGGFISLGAILGPFLAGYLADKVGRKCALLIISVPFSISSLLLAFSQNVGEIYIARFIAGMCVGGSFTILPIYVGEISQDKHRGVLGSSIGVSICAGLFFTYVAGSLIENVMAFNTFLASISAAFFVLFLLFGCETPHWYVSKNKHELAKQTLQKIRNANHKVVERELEHIQSVLESEKPGNIIEIFKTKGSIKSFVIGGGLLFFQQASGINVVLFFAQSIFQKTGTSLKANYCSMIIGAVQFGTSFITPIISNRFGRKFILVFSGIGMCIFENLLGIYSILDDNNHDTVNSFTFLPLLLLVLYIISYNVGFGPIPLVMLGEVFPPNIRAPASGLATSICWLTSFIITKWFSQLAESIGQGECFLGFAIASLVAAAFAQFIVIETKGRTLEQIQEDLNK